MREGEQDTNSSLTIYDLFLRINDIQHIPVVLRKAQCVCDSCECFAKVLVVVVKNGCINPMSHFLMIQILVAG